MKCEEERIIGSVTLWPDSATALRSQCCRRSLTRKNSILTALVSSNRRKLKTLAERYGVKRTFTDEDYDPQSGIVRTRPLCPYPQVAVYFGVGRIDDAKSFSCNLH
jgi:hypothetical protein